ncbi:hypothetical protein EC973_009059 [Apophysomyces ossiformis]|uniref:glucose-6-phosphate 1-epimerase n=1 Tax=Apophysomyces ossiformis TaxID=679940 RepID=A0A8H7BSH6_9FUNG|nr:hypothetical protein EC973_009059 [Apophysomyces ossiformis]
MPAQESDKIVYLEHPSGATAEVSIYGATVTSWTVDKVERLFVSKEAVRDGTKAIRGGIPLVFPIFGTKEKISLPQHALKDTQLTQQQRSSWPHSFRLTYTVTLTAKSLKTVLVLKNEDEDTFEFNTLLHTYFKVPDIANVSVEGLTSRTYHDKVQGGKHVETNEKLTVASEVDRVYCDVPDQLTVHTGNATIGIKKINLKDIVIWNPWIDKARSMGDFGDEEYPEMICVEAGSVADWVKLGGGQSWTGGQILTVLDARQ